MFSALKENITETVAFQDVALAFEVRKTKNNTK